MMSKNILLFFLIGFSFIGCRYSFQGTSIPAEVDSYFVNRFDVRASDAIPTLGQTLSEALKDKIRTESNLTQTDVDPDIEFKGVVNDFRVTFEAPQAGETTSFNRLYISVNIEYIYNLDQEKGWQENFTFFSDFGADVNFIDVQDQLIDDINAQMIEKIFNRAFNNW